MCNLHGTWIPDGVFIFVRGQDGIVPVEVWKREVFSCVASDILADLRERDCFFQMPVSEDDRSATSPSVHLARQTVTGVLLPTRHMFACLSSIRINGQPTGHLHVAGDFRFWQRAALFALELLIRGRATPTVQMVRGKGEGRAGAYCAWVPSLELEADKDRFQAFVAAMPPFCHAFDPGTGQGWLDVWPRDILLSFLTWGMDAWIRHSITDKERVKQQAIFYEHSQSASESLASRWVRGLLQPAEPGLLIANGLEIRKFRDQVEDWISGLRPVHGTVGHTEFFSQTDMRLCLKLQVSPEAVWSLGFYLQSIADPSLLIAADVICDGIMTDTAGLQWNLSGLQEILLKELGRAARIYPVVERALDQGRPTMLELDAAAAHHFLREDAKVLQAGGFGVLLPSWWTQKGRRRLGLKLKVRLPEVSMEAAVPGGHFGLRQLVQFDASAAIGDREVSLSDLDKLAALKVPLVQVQGEWTEVDATEMQRVLDFVRAGGRGEMEMGRFLHLFAAGQNVAEFDALPVVDFEVPASLRGLVDGTLQLPDEGVPTTLNGHLRPYQEKGFSWLTRMTDLGFGVCLADDMGLGKTVQIIALLLARLKVDALPPIQSHPALVVCPTSLLGNWQRELERFGPSLRVFIHHGAKRPRGLEFQRRVFQADVVLSTYHLAYRDFSELSSVEWSHLVLDEAQYIKNSEGKLTQSVHRLRAERKIALTGTPVENRLDELWSLLHFLNPGYLGSLCQFKTRFVVPIAYDQDKEKTEMLQRLIRPFVLRRVKTDPAIIRDLPEKIEIKAYCHLTREQVTLYEAAVKNLLKQIEHANGMQRRGLILASLTKLKQICNHPAHFLHDSSRLHGRSGKLTRLLELLREIRTGAESALVFTQYTEMGELLTRAIANELAEDALFLHGGVTPKQRDELVGQFQAGHGSGIFVLSLKAGGVGLNLTRASHVIHFDRWWNPAVENQATDRAFRIGQKQNVEVHKLICTGTLEDRIDALIDSKRELAERVIGGGENWLTEMSNHELRGLFELRRDIMQEEVGVG